MNEPSQATPHQTTPQPATPSTPLAAAAAQRPAAINTVAQLLRPGTTRSAADVPAADREHAAAVVAHLLHQECRQWSWAEHHPDTHRPEARRIVGALCREGWGPAYGTQGAA